MVNKLKILTEWRFHFERVYDHTINFDELFENEIVCNDNFVLFPDNYMASMIFLANNEGIKFVKMNLETFFNFSDNIFTFALKTLEELFTLSKEKSSNENDWFITSSYLSIVNDKITDRFLPNNESNLKIYDFGTETVVDKLKEIRIKSTDEFANLMK